MLFLLGGLVRATGSGMGCPDWPKCFGLLAPPTCECQLPPNYQQIYLEKRLAKVDRFAQTLEKFGMKEKAAALRADKAILAPEAFNVSKAWIEYINRIFGMISGLLGVAFVVVAVLGKFKNTSRILVIAGFVMLLLNAWLGSIVVATNLLPGIVTLHFLLSFCCVFLFMLALNSHESFATTSGMGSLGRWSLLFVLLMVEVILGTMAREQVEAKNALGTLQNSDGMLDYLNMGMGFFTHRFLPAAILILSLIFGFMVREKIRFNNNAFYYVAALSLLQICFGAINIVFVLPSYSQVLHIALGSLLPVICFYHILRSRPFKSTYTAVTA